MPPLSALLLSLAATAFAQTWEPGPCLNIRTTGVSPLNSAPGEVVELTGFFGEDLPIKVPTVNLGNGNPLEVLRWTPERLKVRLPSTLEPGRHKIGVDCFYGGGSFSSGWFDLVVAASAPPPNIEKLEAPPMTLPADPLMMLGVGQAMWVRRRDADSAAAFAQAAAAFKALGESRHEGLARYRLSQALTVLGRQEESDAELNAAADLAWQALVAAPREEVPRLEREYADIGYSSAEIAMRHGLFDEAERIHRIRLDIFERLSDVGGQAVAWQGLARAAAGAKNHSEAALRFDRASALYRLAGNPHGVKACADGAQAALKALNEGQ